MKGLEVFCKMIVAFLNKEHVVNEKNFYMKGDDQEYAYFDCQHKKLFVLRKDKKAFISQDLFAPEIKFHFELISMLEFCGFHVEILVCWDSLISIKTD